MYSAYKTLAVKMNWAVKYYRYYTFMYNTVCSYNILFAKHVRGMRIDVCHFLFYKKTVTFYKLQVKIPKLGEPVCSLPFAAPLVVMPPLNNDLYIHVAC